MSRRTDVLSGRAACFMIITLCRGGAGGATPHGGPFIIMPHSPHGACPGYIVITRQRGNLLAHKGGRGGGAGGVGGRGYIFMGFRSSRVGCCGKWLTAQVSTAKLYFIMKSNAFPNHKQEKQEVDSSSRVGDTRGIHWVSSCSLPLAFNSHASFPWVRNKREDD